MDAQARSVELLDDLVHRHPRVQAGKMFGMPVFKANGKAAAGLRESSMVLNARADRWPALADAALGA